MIVLQRRILWRRRERTGTTMWIGQISASVGMSCHQPARTTRGCPGYIRSRARCTIGFDASVVRTNACDGSSKPSDVNKPRQQRSALAARQNSCRQAEACGRHQRDNGQICSGRREGRKYRAVNSGAAGSDGWAGACRSRGMARCRPHGCYGRHTGARRGAGRCRRGVRRS
jgi:hypothetical protein